MLDLNAMVTHPFNTYFFWFYGRRAGGLLKGLVKI